ncbi:hypothetical protein QEO94_00080 [Kingella negevensis]|uniref:hypothetical protein n=1 Tax=Kingella negevensis TaxID=1522312 RepID=UPI002543FB18|nr:hypothetical protein [Kingella negevensis]WII93298.1 hypothetical protein QEO94_00080 [Kingella negevensis]
MIFTLALFSFTAHFSGHHRKLKELKDGFKRKISKKHIEDSYKIIVILESPHKDEYKDDRNKPTPAKGKTGKNIRKYLADIISKLDSDKSKNYPIFLINPIQYQCSKGETNRSKTKKVFQRIMA